MNKAAITLKTYFKIEHNFVFFQFCSYEFRNFLNDFACDYSGYQQDQS